MREFIDRFLAEDGYQLFNGNELLVKGAFETPGGVHLLTGYPGSPVATFFDTLGKLRHIVKDKGIRAHIANNEANAAAMVNGSQMGPFRAMCVIKSVGGHVAADGLALGNLAGPNPEGGAVIVFGDDPWSESTQVPADSRFLSEHLRMPVIEPSTPQEVKDFVPLAFDLSKSAGLYIGYILTTLLADGGGAVKVSKNHWPEKSTKNPIELNTSTLDLEKTVLLPPKTGKREEDIPQRFTKLITRARVLNINKILGPIGKNKIGFITCGVAWQYLVSTLDELNLLEKYPILKMGLTYPLDERLIAEFATNFDHILVIEERRGFLEQQIAELISRAKQLNPGVKFANIWGKKFPSNHEGIPATRGLNPSIVMDKVIKFIKLTDHQTSARLAHNFERQLDKIRKASSGKINLIPRPPTFCPGCPHRDSASLLLEIREKFKDPKYMQKKYKRNPIDLVFHGDTGCYTMLMFPPYTELMHNYSGMGLGGATGAGIDPFITNKQVVFMGDSTFFHSGQIAISNSIKAKQDITYIILDNRTTAMTGHQPTPGIEEDILGNKTPMQEIEKIVKSITASDNCTVIRTDPSDRKSYEKILTETILKDGVKVIIADKECGITTLRKKQRKERAEQRKTGFVAEQRFMNITPELCELCRECAKYTGCPGLNLEETPFGTKMTTDLSWCVNDGACAKIGACPSFEEVIVKRINPPRPRGHQIKFERIPEPKIKVNKDHWQAHIAGVGGMGIGIATAILVRAGDKDGYKILFADKKGLAIRNGGVYSQLVFYKDNKNYSQVLPYGSADLLLGLDIVEAARAVDPQGPFRIASPEKTSAVVNTDFAPTVEILCGKVQYTSEDAEREIKRYIKPENYFSHNITALCERLFGTKLYANITMIGYAYQLGLIPVSLNSLEWAIFHTIPADFKKNMRAFNLGRKLAAHPELFTEKPQPKTIARIVREKATIMEHTWFNGQRIARQYKYLVYTTLRACRELDKPTMCDLALRLYELIRYENLEYAKQYAERIKTVYRKDRKDYNFAATKSVIWNLFKLMVIKDEFYVARILTSYEKQRRDHHRYNVNPANGDKIYYKRTFYPRFFGKKVPISIPHWSLKILANLKFIRKFLPLYHREDKLFLRWYLNLLEGFIHRSEHEYLPYLKALQTVDQVKGYREYRTPTMEKAKQEAEDILSSLPTISDKIFERPLSERFISYPDKSISAERHPHIINRIMKMLKL